MSRLSSSFKTFKKPDPKLFSSIFTIQPKPKQSPDSSSSLPVSSILGKRKRTFEETYPIPSEENKIQYNVTKRSHPVTNLTIIFMFGYESRLHRILISHQQHTASQFSLIQCYYVSSLEHFFSILHRKPWRFVTSCKPSIVAVYGGLKSSCYPNTSFNDTMYIPLLNYSKTKTSVSSLKHIKLADVVSMIVENSDFKNLKHFHCAVLGSLNIKETLLDPIFADNVHSIQSWSTIMSKTDIRHNCEQYFKSLYFVLHLSTIDAEFLNQSKINISSQMIDMKIDEKTIEVFDLTSFHSNHSNNSVTSSLEYSSMSSPLGAIPNSPTFNNSTHLSKRILITHIKSTPKPLIKQYDFYYNVETLEDAQYLLTLPWETPISSLHSPCMLIIDVQLQSDSIFQNFYLPSSDSFLPSKFFKYLQELSSAQRVTYMHFSPPFSLLSHDSQQQKSTFDLVLIHQSSQNSSKFVFKTVQLSSPWLTWNQLLQTKTPEFSHFQWHLLVDHDQKKREINLTKSKIIGDQIKWDTFLPFEENSNILYIYLNTSFNKNS